MWQRGSGGTTQPQLIQSISPHNNSQCKQSMLHSIGDVFVKAVNARSVFNPLQKDPCKHFPGMAPEKNPVCGTRSPLDFCCFPPPFPVSSCVQAGRLTQGAHSCSDFWKSVSPSPSSFIRVVYNVRTATKN
jgi:hypothetical protein